MRPRLEELETRDLPSAGAWIAHPLNDATPLAGGGSSQGYDPATIRNLYGFNQLQANGYGQTIAIVDAYDNPNIYNDLTVFDRSFGLPGQGSDVGYYLTKLNQVGGTSAYPPPDAGWAGEIALDVEWAHAIAPYAHIVLVETNSASFADLLAGVDLARHIPGVAAVSMSWGGTEFSYESYYDSLFTTPAGHTGVTFVASTGDNGAGQGPSWPSVSPNVLGIGGTTLYASGYETGWSGSGGGISKYEYETNFQVSVQTIGMRTSPDVSYDADPATGVLAYSSYSGGGWYRFGGTSAGAPQWAAVLALANQQRSWYGMSTIADAQAFLYTLSNNYFRDPVSGYNGYSAGPGYDLVTGRGSPTPWIINALTWYYHATPGGNLSVSAHWSYGTPLSYAARLGDDTSGPTILDAPTATVAIPRTNDAPVDQLWTQTEELRAPLLSGTEGARLDLSFTAPQSRERAEDDATWVGNLIGG
jgi:subtilase family serine protease